MLLLRLAIFGSLLGLVFLCAWLQGILLPVADEGPPTEGVEEAAPAVAFSYQPIPGMVSSQEKDDAVEQFFDTQRGLLELLPPGSRTRADWNTYYSRPTAPPSTPTDTAILKQLQERKLCSRLQANSPWTHAQLLVALKEFVTDVYPRRPNKDNNLGMGFNHAFLAWLYTLHVKPDYIVENGIHKGQSTWLLRQASPHAKIFSFDPKATIIKYWDPEVEYYVGDASFSKPGFRVQPFVDFDAMDWDRLIPNKSRALILFDDHQNHLKRLQQMAARGFKRAMFDDNWPELQGDNLSLKQMCDETGGLALRKPGFPDERVLVMDDFHMNDRFITKAEHLANRQLMHSMVNLYFEGPPPLFHPRHLLFTTFGHKPKKDTTPYPLVLPKPSNKLLAYLSHALIPRPIITNRTEFDYVGLTLATAGLTQSDFGGHGCPCYIELR
uniref:Uncharacterized protein n=1 Tax=Eutreptiella gymnastica TaxID=73025 RepID=A0A7S1JA91_9EUGL|mmetsp:Transcript_79550/g.140385  ORF Transcript_79550/g.140385 Transcript_79550/m.140385 type:complete len:439 (+) Transcript_79550:132-1448(+)